jgi:hypothetical protein
VVICPIFRNRQKKREGSVEEKRETFWLWKRNCVLETNIGF